MLIIHHDDLDGRAAAAIAYIYGQGVDVRFHETNYETPPPNVEPGETVCILDFSYKPEDMAKITAKTDDVIWCDHHKTAKDYKYEFDGFRDFTDKGLSGCECAWKYFNPDKPIPRGIQMLGSYDSWRSDFGEDAKTFYEGLKTQDVDPTSDFWSKLINDDDECDRILEIGKTVVRYRDAYLDDLRDAHAYETTFDDKHCLALNVARFGSAAFGDDHENYDMCISYIHDGKRFIVSLYSEKVDVGEVCKRYGGGGHKGAAGFSCEKLPWLEDDVNLIAKTM